jgi:hypothetical protein
VPCHRPNKTAPPSDSAPHKPGTGAREAVYVWRFARREGSPQPSAIGAASSPVPDGERVEEVQG